jgi:hypothetical protein
VFIIAGCAGKKTAALIRRGICREAEGCIWNPLYERRLSYKGTIDGAGFSYDYVVFMLVSGRYDQELVAQHSVGCAGYLT